VRRRRAQAPSGARGSLDELLASSDVVSELPVQRRDAPPHRCGGAGPMRTTAYLVNTAPADRARAGAGRRPPAGVIAGAALGLRARARGGPRLVSLDASCSCPHLGSATRPAAMATSPPATWPRSWPATRRSHRSADRGKEARP
jgi:hypothetical protein